MMGRRANKPTHKQCGGFTLIELVLTVLVICSLAAIIIPKLDFDVEAVSSPKTLEQAIRTTRANPGYIIERFNIAEKDNTFRIYYLDDAGAEKEVLVGTVPSGTHIRPKFELSFNNLGQPFSKGNLMSNSLDIELYKYEDPNNPDEEKTILVGTVTVEKNTGAVWTVYP
ncbi:MAG: type II secretion system protein [Magnetococcales bacterium]|nr:type II secretion system protein [Magnetococcales bacterium]